jgi:outer membrane receptor protein involved in Fe transport
VFDKVRRHQESAPDGDVGDDVHAFNPLVGARYNLSPEIDLHASISRKIRFPTMRNLYASGVLGPQGDPDLKEQRSYNYELGSTWKLDEKTSLDGALFFNDVKDYIYFDNLIGRFEQLDRCSIYGIELSAANQLTPHTSARLSYTFMRSEVHSDVQLENQYHPDLVFDPDEIPYHPQHKIDLDISQSFSWGMQADFNGSFLSRQTFIDYADPNNNQVLVADEKHLGSYFLLNAKITQEITKQIKMYLAVDNLLNEDYQDLYLLPGRGITAWAGLKIEL